MVLYRSIACVCLTWHSHLVLCEMVITEIEKEKIWWTEVRGLGMMWFSDVRRAVWRLFFPSCSSRKRSSTRRISNGSSRFRSTHLMITGREMSFLVNERIAVAIENHIHERNLPRAYISQVKNRYGKKASHCQDRRKREPRVHYTSSVRNVGGKEPKAEKKKKG